MMARETVELDQDRVQTYLRDHGYIKARVRSMTPLSESCEEDGKCFGYGSPPASEHSAVRCSRTARLYVGASTPEYNQDW